MIRLVYKEVSTLTSDPPEGIKVFPNEEDITDVQVTIEGPGKRGLLEEGSSLVISFKGCISILKCSDYAAPVKESYWRRAHLELLVKRKEEVGCWKYEPYSRKYSSYRLYSFNL